MSRLFTLLGVFLVPALFAQTGSLGTGKPASTAAPQNPNEIVDKEFGVRFTLPKGWIAQKSEAGYLLGSQTEKGIILMAGNEYSSLEQMRAEARQGLVDENGTNLQLAGEIVTIGERMLGAPYQGMIEGQPAKAYAVGLLSPLGGGVTGVDARKKPELPDGFSLSQNYPNPFNPSTQIKYTLPALSHVALKIYDILGREVRTLVDGFRPPGVHTVRFDATGLASGVYFYKLTTERFSSIKKMLLVW